MHRRALLPLPRLLSGSYSYSSAAADSTPLHETIVFMMRRRAWTTRLEHSLRQIVSPGLTTRLVLDVIKAASSIDRHDLALQFFRFAERRAGFRHNAETFSAIIPPLANAGMLNHARCLILESMPRCEVPADEYSLSALIVAYGKHGIPQESVKLFRKMPELNIVRTHVAYDAIFKAILVNGRVAMAQRIYNFMIREKVKPTVSTYNTLIWGFCLSGKMGKVVKFLEDMKLNGLEPDIVTYNTLLNGWVRVGKMEDAKKVFADMVSASLLPNTVSYNLMIKGYVGSKRVDDALRLFEEMETKGVRYSEKTFAALWPGLCDDECRVDKAKIVLEMMAKLQLTPRDKSVFRRLVSTMCRTGDLEGAMQTHKRAGQFNDVTVEPQQYGVLIESLCHGGKHDLAVTILDDLMEKGALDNPKAGALDPSAYNPIIEYLCGNGSTKKAESFFRQLLKKGVDDKVAFNHLIRGHAREGVPEAAQDILAIMTRQSIKTEAESYELLIDCFIKKGETSDAKRVLDSMMEQGHSVSADLFRYVMVALFDDGRVQTTSRVMKSMIETGIKENMDMVQKILEALFMRGHVDEAIGRINFMMNNGVFPELDKLLLALCEANKVMEAHKLADFTLERDLGISFSTYDRVLEVLTEVEALAAYSLLTKIKRKGGIVNHKGCDMLIESLKSEGHMKQADIVSRTLAGKSALTSTESKPVAMEA